MFNQLEYLDLINNSITDKGLKYLIPCLDFIGKLWIMECDVTEAGVEEIRSELRRRGLPVS